MASGCYCSTWEIQMGSWRSAYRQRDCLSYAEGRGIWASIMNGRDLNEVKFSSVHIMLFFFYFIFKNPRFKEYNTVESQVWTEHKASGTRKGH